MTNGPVDEIKHNFVYLDKALSGYDARFTLKVLRGLPALRRQLDSEVLSEIIKSTYPQNDPAGQELLRVVASGEAAGTVATKMSDGTEDAVIELPSPETDAYVHLLVQIWLLHRDVPDQFYTFSQTALAHLRKYDRRSLDFIVAKIWFYYVRAAELTDNLEHVVPPLMAGLRTATLRHDAETQGMLVILLLRSYLLLNKISQAAGIISKTSFPPAASNSLAARYYYYLSRVSAIQLDYSSAFEQITAAIRKVPQSPASIGFLQTAHKLSIVIELLMGEIPDREVFKKPEFRRSLAPYLALTRAVRAGDIQQFGSVLVAEASALKADHNYALACRLRQNVIKTGIRILSLTYSRISLKDICIKLCLDGEESAEYIVAKAIRDGVIDAEINHQYGYMQSKEVTDIYSTAEPQYTFHERIKFCMALHDDSVKAMRYLSSDHAADLKDAEEAREREKELVTEIQEGTDLEDDDDFEL